MDLQNYKELSVSEKVLLVEEIWDSIAEEAIKIKNEHKELLDERLKIVVKSKKRTTWQAIQEKVKQK